tara:strand:- start:458 stop:667 length:210 start_codon:yes stop_codon:yes gene_type:complete
MTEEDKKNERIKKDLKYYDERDEVTKKYAHDIADELEEHFPKDFFTEHNVKYSIECILGDMYKEIKPNE